MIWALQSTINTSQALEVQEILTKNKIVFFTADPIPFTMTLQTEGLYTGTDVIPYGSNKLMMIAKARGWGGLCLNDNFDVRVWNKNHPDMLNTDSEVFTIKEAMEFTRAQDPDQEFSIRPVFDLKTFPGVCTVASEIAHWMDSIETKHFVFTEEDLAVISSPKDIDAEWRHFIVGGKIVSSSMYKARGRLRAAVENDPDVIREAQGLADKWLPHENVVMDIALWDGKVKVLEFNCINASGFYKHDVKKIILEMDRTI